MDLQCLFHGSSFVACKRAKNVMNYICAIIAISFLTRLLQGQHSL